MIKDNRIVYGGGSAEAACGIAISKYAAVESTQNIFTTNANPSLKDMPMYPAPASMDSSDAPYSEMTIRDYYAIHTGKPVSSKNWLNELIKSK